MHFDTPSNIGGQVNVKIAGDKTYPNLQFLHLWQGFHKFLCHCHISIWPRLNGQKMNLDTMTFGLLKCYDLKDNCHYPVNQNLNLKSDTFSFSRSLASIHIFYWYNLDLSNIQNRKVFGKANAKVDEID